MKSIVRIALDVMGGDKGPSIAISGAAETLIRHPDVRFIMHGDEALCRPILETFPALKAVTTLHHSEISIAMDDKPSQALRRGRGFFLGNFDPVRRDFPHWECGSLPGFFS